MWTLYYTHNVLSAHAHNLAQYVGKGRQQAAQLSDRTCMLKHQRCMQRARGMCSIVTPRACARGKVIGFVCRLSSFYHVINTGLRSEINQQTVKCINHNEGCEWTGELGEIEYHLESDSGCGFVVVTCPNKCSILKLTSHHKSRKRLKGKGKILSHHETQRFR